MQIAVHDTTPGELEAIFRIRNDPLVLQQQYRVSLMGTVDDWRDRLAGNVDTGIYTFRSSTVLDGDTIVGHVSQAHMLSNDIPVVQCGWNLTPEYWGRGVMCVALTDLFNQFFTQDGVAHVFADCFRDNRRCIRLMEKLGFVPNGIPLHHRAMIACSSRCFRWIKRFRLDAATWGSTKRT